MSPGFSVREVAAQCLTYSTEAQLITFDRSVDLRRNPSISIILPKTHETFVNFLEGRHYKERLYFVTEWVVAHGPKMTTLISRSKIPHDELIKMAYFFAQIYFCFPETSPKPLQIWRILVRRVSTQELRSWKVQKQVRIFWGSWRGKMGTGISLILDWENGIYSLGLGFSHWEWDEQL